MTETRQLVAGSLRFEDEDAVSAVPRRATRTNADAHFFPEDLLERECLGTWGQRFLYQEYSQKYKGTQDFCEGWASEDLGSSLSANTSRPCIFGQAA